MVFLAFYLDDGKLFDKVVRWRTNSEIVHCELYLSVDGRCFSSSQWDGGTRWKVIDLGEKGKWAVIAVPGISEDKVKAEIKKYEGRKYDLPNILRIMAGIKTKNTDGILFCTEVCVRVLQTFGWGTELIPDAVTPDNLFDYARGYVAGWKGCKGRVVELVDGVKSMKSLAEGE